MNIENNLPLKLREIVLNTREPLILRNFKTKWNCFKGTIEEWCQKYDEAKNAPSSFMQRRRCRTNKPQWERENRTIPMKTKEFLEQYGKENEFWAALHYVRANELPGVCREGVDFGCFGFAAANDDYSYWLSSKGANTPCHYDSYGCNIVVQIYGSKSWLLFPPQTALTTTRIPYEESSVYCLENFYSPSAQELLQFQQIQANCYHCILQPNDVLIVPRHWWHYVQANELSLSINAWIPLELDVEAQLEEAIVKFLIESLYRNADAATLKLVLNPNQLHQIAETKELCDIVEHLLAKTTAKDEHMLQGKKQNQALNAYQYMSEDAVKALMLQIPRLQKVDKTSNAAFQSIFNDLPEGLASSEVEVPDAADDAVQQLLINSICSPQLVRRIRQELVKRYKLKLNKTN